MFPCIPSEPVVPQRRSPASSRVRACAVLLAVLMLLASAAAQAAPGPARRPAAPFDLLAAIRAWMVALIAPTADGDGGVAARTPGAPEESALHSGMVSTADNSDAGVILDPDGHH